MQIDQDRLWDRLHRLGGIGKADDGDGITRLAWTPAYRQAMELLIAWGDEIGLRHRIDTVGNLFLRLEGEQPDAPAVLSGSHLDTVPNGGYFDGLAGIVAVLEAIQTIKASGAAHPRPIELVAFINEEATAFLGGTFGSKAFCGMLPSDYADICLHRITGQPLRQAMLEFGMGLDPDRLADSAVDPGGYCGFLELHIEQGRHLLDAGLPLAVVTDIAGIKQFYISIFGQAAHAGGMAMADRRDALAAAARVACEVERLALSSPNDTRGTVGYIEAQPGEHNIIAQKCVVPVDFREAEDATFERLYSDLHHFTEQLCLERELRWQVDFTLDSKPAHCHPKIVSQLLHSAEQRGIPHTHMVSYPCHDAVHLSRIMPMGMIFLRSSNGGVSHCPQEFTEKADLAQGTAILADTLLSMAVNTTL